MIDSEYVKQLLTKNESPILEFKRQWYWLDDDEEGLDRSQLMGEFYKDIISLCNGYLDFVGEDRYLIFGYCETEQKIFSVDTSKVSILRSVRDLKRKVISRLESLVSAPLLEFDVEIVTLESDNLIVFRIPSPKRVATLKDSLTTKTRTLDSGAVLVRKGQNSDSIRAATYDELTELKAQFDSFKATIENLPLPLSVEPRQRSITTTVQLYIERNASYSIDVDYPKSHKDWNENIIFELFQISEALGSKKYFLYIHEHAAQAKTYGYLKSKNLLVDSHPIIVLTERPSIKDSERRKDNIAQLFKTDYVFFIDEFGFDYLYRDYIQKYEKYNQSVFVKSVCKEVVDGTDSALTILKQWYESVAAPVMVIKGYGGIGKTTVVKQFLDDIYDSKRNTGLLFIDSKEIIDRLARIAKSEKKIDDLYDFYLAQSQDEHASDAKNLSKELLKLSVDNGDLIIVLDGLDEVIARLGANFDVASFINSTSTGYSSNLERAKIIITCRDNFWRTPDVKSSTREITLVPFNEQMASEFFRQSFSSDEKKIELAMNMAHKFALRQITDSSNESIYIPYVLDMIVFLIQRKGKLAENSATAIVKSNILSADVSNDFLVSSVCEREIEKLANVGVSDQINFFIEFAVKSHVSLYDIKALFQNATSVQINDDTIEKLKGHPLLSCAENTVNFRYDFFNDYFKTLYVVRYFLDKKVSQLTSEMIVILGSYIGFDNEFTRATHPRLKLSDELIIFSLETIDALTTKLSEGDNLEQGRIRAAISGVFMLLLTLQRIQSNSNLDTTACTNLLHQVFEHNGVLDGVSLVDVFGSDKARPIFDFRNKKIINSHFERYEFFWDCPLNDLTNFNYSGFFNLEPRSGVTPKFYQSTFGGDCDISDISHILSTRTKEITTSISLIKSNLLQLFKLFHSRGNFYPQKQEYIRSKVFTGKLLPTLLRQKVIVEYTDSGKPTLRQYKVADSYRPIVKLLEQGGASLEFEQVIEMFVSAQ